MPPNKAPIVIRIRPIRYDHALAAWRTEARLLALDVRLRDAAARRVRAAEGTPGRDAALRVLATHQLAAETRLDAAMKASAVLESSIEVDGLDDDTGWVETWVRHGQRRLDLIRRLATHGKGGKGSFDARMAPLVAWREDVAHAVADPIRAIRSAMSSTPTI